MAGIRINTRFGELNIDPSQVITFPRGIPGFEKNTMWKLLHEVDAQGNWVSGVVVHLQSVDDGEVSLPLTDPTLFGFNFDLTLNDSEVAELGLEDPNDILVLMALSAREGGGNAVENMYANIAAPILINIKSRIGMQKLLTRDDAKVEFRQTATA